jgi:hypothetical protein
MSNGKKALDLLIQAEEEAKKYLLPISAKEWVEITHENLANYGIVSIDALIDSEEEFRFYTNDDDISERQESRYQESRLGLSKKELDRIGLDNDLEAYQIYHSLMKYIMITKGKKEGAKFIVDVKIQEIEDRPYMTGIGLVPLSEEEKEPYTNISDTLNEMHKKLSDKK